MFYYYFITRWSHFHPSGSTTISLLLLLLLLFFACEHYVPLQWHGFYLILSLSPRAKYNSIKSIPLEIINLFSAFCEFWLTLKFWNAYDSLVLNFSYEFNLWCEYLEQMFFYFFTSRAYQKDTIFLIFELAHDFKTSKIRVWCDSTCLAIC